jgi:Uri superfamily endonuclease
MVGNLGIIEFKHGKYIYVGSALNSLEPRLIRHLKINKGLHKVRHWHIDYLLTNSSAKIHQIYVKISPKHLECSIAEKISSQGVHIPKFGSSDCKCKSHLFKVDNFNFLEKIGLKKLDLNQYSPLL